MPIPGVDYPVYIDFLGKKILVYFPPLTPETLAICLIALFAAGAFGAWLAMRQ